MKTLTTFQIAEMLNMDISTVIDWIDAGRIVAFKTPGGHRRVKVSDFSNFLKEYKMPVPEEIVLYQKTGFLNNTKKILVADDDENILKFISVAIKKFFRNFAVETAPDGFTAGKKIAELKPDILILDIKMPGMDGFQVLGNLKKEKMKVIAITAYPSKEIHEGIIKSGADDYLVKPFTVDELKQKINNLVGGKK